MKKLLVSLSLLLSTGLSHAATITLSDTVCTGGTPFCSNPAPDVSLLTYSPTYGRLTLTIDGVQYVSAPYSASAQGGTVYADDGSWREVSTVFATWLTCTRTGRGQTCLTHWELKSGSVTN